MSDPEQPTFTQKIKMLVIGRAKSPTDKATYHSLSLIAFFAWVGLGADGLSSSCYGPPEAFIGLVDSGGVAHPHLGLFVALATALTIFVISTSYSQIIELFPSGGGGYLVASKLLSSRAGMVSGCALLVDYVLTITVSVATGTDALFSFFPPAWQQYKLISAVGVVMVLTLLNIRGVRESVTPLIPIFLIFVLTHVVIIVYSCVVHAGNFSTVAAATTADVRQTSATLGIWGMIFLIMHSYSMGAGTYTGIEAVSNGIPVLREPRVQTAKRTMTYMWVSLALMVVGLMVAYLLYDVREDKTGGKTLNAVLLSAMTGSWHPALGQTFLIVTLVSEAAILYVAAQTGFLGGPRVLANMAADRWFPTRFSMLNDRLVTQNGVLMMSGAAIITMVATGGSATYLIVLYSINVFITFALSQMGMVRHWWTSRAKVPDWIRRLFINGVGLALTLVILVWITVVKFNQGGWVTLVVTGALIMLVSLIRRHYNDTGKLLRKINELARMASLSLNTTTKAPAHPFDPKAKTAVLLVSGYNGMGIHSVLNILRFFGETFHNFVFIQIGLVDAGNFKGTEEVEKLQTHIGNETHRYVDFINRQGYYAEAVTSIGNDIADEVANVAPAIVEKYPQSVFFAGQLVLPKDTFISQWLHNNIAFSVQRQLYRQGIPFVIMPIRL